MGEVSGNGTVDGPGRFRPAGETMAERAQAVGADLAFTGAAGEGTTVMVTLPPGPQDLQSAGPDAS